MFMMPASRCFVLFSFIHTAHLDEFGRGSAGRSASPSRLFLVVSLVCTESFLGRSQEAANSKSTLLASPFYDASFTSQGLVSTGDNDRPRLMRSLSQKYA